MADPARSDALVLFGALFAWLFLGEPIRVPTLVGGALILAGIAITAHAA